MTHTHEHHAFNRAFALSVALNLAITIIQIFYAYTANSMSLLSDGVHNAGDVLGLVLAWGANWLLTLPARKRYSYGYKRITILAAIANALLLVSTSVLIIYESINRLMNLTSVDTNIIIIVALLGIVINGGTALLFREGAHGDLNIKGAFLHLIADAFISVGVVVGALLIHYTGKLWIDPILGLIIVSIILWGTWGLLRDSVSLILDAIPHHIDQQGVTHFLHQLPGVKAVHDLHIWGLSTKEIALTAHLVIPDRTISDAEYQDINKVLLDKFKINHVTLQVEKGHVDYPCGQSEPC